MNPRGVNIGASGMPYSDAQRPGPRRPRVWGFSSRGLFFLHPRHKNAMPPSCAKYHDAKPEVLDAQVPLYSAWCLVLFVLPSISSYAKRILAF